MIIGLLLWVCGRQRLGVGGTPGRADLARERKEGHEKGQAYSPRQGHAPMPGKPPLACHLPGLPSWGHP